MIVHQRRDGGVAAAVAWIDAAAQVVQLVAADGLVADVDLSSTIAGVDQSIRRDTRIHG